jgi:hypothetical protein
LTLVRTVITRGLTSGYVVDGIFERRMVWPPATCRAKIQDRRNYSDRPQPVGSATPSGSAQKYEQSDRWSLGAASTAVNQQDGARHRAGCTTRFGSPLMLSRQQIPAVRRNEVLAGSEAGRLIRRARFAYAKPRCVVPCRGARRVCLPSGHGHCQADLPMLSPLLRTEKEHAAATNRWPAASAQPQPGAAQRCRIRHRRRCRTAGIADRRRRRHW